jgi:hypothetical protein
VESFTGGRGEVLPYYENKIYLDHQNLDQWDYSN